MIHLPLAAFIQALTAYLTGDLWLGAAIASGFFCGREHAQAEYRWIERYGFGLRANMPWHGGFQSRVWNIKSVLDFALPVVFTCSVAPIVG
jgi:hypothetical protein